MEEIKIRYFIFASIAFMAAFVIHVIFLKITFICIVLAFLAMVLGLILMKNILDLRP
ncbi:hypothetical protein [Pseudolactococcus carnosus]|uniref:Uncharacterized protein n=1 Tax=Pseudolactococcus carnosus TaxID=2749961 RepID=A0ABT0AQZ0_9LACT|nr:hypothetical protein [Lactococcus carnosus]MCJ1989114.1 hypothetical protein [Lactococcus carnosus]